MRHPEKQHDEVSVVSADRQKERILHRDASASSFSPITFYLRYGTEKIKASVVNFHFLGASLRVEKGDLRALQPDVTLELFLGQKCIRSHLAFQVCWEEIAESGCFGVKFKESIRNDLRKAERVQVSATCPPTLTAKDPTNPTRELYFTVADFSKGGLLLRTSASNRFLFPGMSLEKCKLTIPGRDPADLSLYIANVRPGKSQDHILVGVSIREQGGALFSLLSEYALVLSPAMSDPSKRVDDLVNLGQVFAKQIKKGLTYRVVSTPSEYEDVLKLRFLGYGKAGKVQEGKTWKDMGEGLDQEGTIVGAYLGGQLIAAVEIRFGNKMPLRISKSIRIEDTRLFDPHQVIEPNRLVIHPRMQGTDIVVGMIQRIHAMAVLNDHMNILLFATDKLAPLYEKMGAEHLGRKVPHPVLTGENLNLMIARSEMYLEADGMNPFAWSQIWEATHEYLVDLGLEKPIRKTLGWKLRFWIGKTAFALNQFIKKKRPPQSGPRDSSTKEFIDPKWTEQHLAAQVMIPYLLEAEAMIGERSVSSILATLGLPREYFFKQSNWVSMHFFDRFLEEFKKYGDVTRLNKNSGARSMQREVLGLTYYFIKHFATAELLFRSLGKVATRFNRTRTYEVVKMQPGSCTIRVGYFDKSLLPKDSSACLNWIGNFEAVIGLVGNGKSGIVHKTACCLRGNDDACEYEIHWPKKNTVLNQLFRYLPLAAIPAAIWSTLSWSFDHVMFSRRFDLIVSSLLVWSAFHLVRLRIRFQSLTGEFEQFHQESDERYSELQKSQTTLDKSYQEARLLEDLAKEIQKPDRLTNTMNTTVSAVCEKFGFSRAFIMLKDLGTRTLRTSAVAGTKDHSDMIWAFTVDVSKIRDDVFVLSSVYHSGQPILISDVNAHKFQLNKASQRMIESLKTAGFAMVPIPAQNGNWGVLVADKSADATTISQADLIMLQRVAQHLGIALDIRTKLEEEEKLRRVFQKFVPSRIVNGIISADEPILGGETREITCMFIDIRGFTALSQNYSSPVVLDLLNRFFSMVQAAVREGSGLIDKFLGDGVLVTWGATGDGGSHASEAVETAMKILERKDELNRQFEQANLPKIEIGIGINSGPALVGNIGSEERMEFTAIGPTVNLASRLEGLCKTYDAQIVISEPILESLSREKRQNWKIVENASVRGIDHALRLGLFQVVHQRNAEKEAG